MFEVSAVLTHIFRTILAVFGVRYQAYDMVDLARDIERAEEFDDAGQLDAYEEQPAIEDQVFEFDHVGINMATGAMVLDEVFDMRGNLVIASI